MWSSTVGLINGKHRYLTAETFGFKVNSTGQMLKKRQQWTIEPFPDISGPDGSISSAASVSSQGLNCPSQAPQSMDPNDPCILTFGSGAMGSSLTSIKSSSNNSSNPDPDTCGDEYENVAIKSHLDKYLAVDSFGNVTCDLDEKTENARFTITICSMSLCSKEEHIYWAFRNTERGYYLGTAEDGTICCNAKMPKSKAELWHVHLLPARGASFFALKSLGRKRFARVVGNESQKIDNGNQAQIDKFNSAEVQVQLDATLSWGPETLFQFKYYDGGRYSLLTNDCRYITKEGKCIKWTAPDESALPPPECLFTLEYHSGFLAFRDLFGHYLAAAGRSSILKSRSIGVTRDELFTFESAPIQVSLKAVFNNRWVSIKQGVDLSANQAESNSVHETFQFNYHKQTRNWSIMTHDCNFWTATNNTSTISTCKPGDYEGLIRGQFKLIWSDTDATCSLRFSNVDGSERCICARKSGQLYLGNSSQKSVNFIMRFQNRRLLNLRPVNISGFVGVKPNTNCKQLEANKTCSDPIAIEYSESSSSNGNSSGYVTLRPVRNRPNDAQNTESSNEVATNIFNIKLNSTHNNILERLNNKQSGNQNGQLETQKSRYLKISNPHRVEDEKEVEYGIDENNNDNLENPNHIIPEKTNLSAVELSSTPSVASIINSFSNVDMNQNHADQMQTNRLQPTCSKTNSSVLRLASTFEGQQPPQHNDGSSDTLSVITSISSNASASSYSAVSSNLTNGGTNTQLSVNNTLINNDQIAQAECCYLKMVTNNRYLNVGDNESSIICDATNKACAQPWILELRSHNSLAIRASDIHAYMQLGTNGTIMLTRCSPEEATLWEF